MDCVMDSGSDITIIGKEMFRNAVSVAKLHKRDLKSPEKQPSMYNLQPFHVDGWIEVDISFGDHTMKTWVCIKMDVPEQLLHSEGVCRQLGVIRYHPEVKPGNMTAKAESSGVSDCKFPMVTVKLVCDIRLIPNQHVMAEDTLQREGVSELGKPLLFEPDMLLAEERIHAMVTVLPNHKEKFYVLILN